MNPIQVSLTEDQSRAAFRLSHIITADMVAALTQALESLADSPHLKLVTIEGAGPDFSFGASVPEHAPGEIDRVLPAMHALIYALLDFPAVTAAIVRGRCLGGGFELALACDFVFAERDATFGLPEIALGVFPPAASALLPANPHSTLPSLSRRIFMASAFMMAVPSVTWPSPPMATLPP